MKRLTTMRSITTWFLCASISLATSYLRAQEPEGPEAGKALASQLSSLEPDENSQWTGRLNIKSRNGEAEVIPVRCQVIAGSGHWQVIYTSTAKGDHPAEQLTVVHSTNGPTQYLLAKAAKPDAALGKPVVVNGKALEAPFAGSDFWLSELGFEFYHWPSQKRLKGAMRRGQPCYVLESVNTEAKVGDLAKVVTFVDRESGQPILAEGYRFGELRSSKDFSLGKMTKVNGRWTPKNLEIEDRVRKSRTTLEFDVEAEPKN